MAAVRAAGEGPPRLLALGEAKLGTVLGVEQLERLATARELAGKQGFDTATARLLCASGAGFTPEFRRLAGADEGVQLVDLDRLYHGD